MASSFSINENNNYFGNVSFGLNNMPSSQTNRYSDNNTENAALRNSDGNFVRMNVETPETHKNKPAVRAFESIRKSGTNQLNSDSREVEPNQFKTFSANNSLESIRSIDVIDKANKQHNNTNRFSANQIKEDYKESNIDGVNPSFYNTYAPENENIKAHS